MHGPSVLSLILEICQQGAAQIKSTHTHTLMPLNRAGEQPDDEKGKSPHFNAEFD